jgi:hypothetical protein
MNKEEVNPEINESLRNQSDRTTKFICKVCGAGFEEHIIYTTLHF